MGVMNETLFGAIGAHTRSIPLDIVCTGERLAKGGITKVGFVNWISAGILTPNPPS
jgi:hypothetical protein